ncbi:MAG: hypothetical protein IJ038_03340 [Clostridia bacterium]|nr:hypothetical protein [Clostridia bacterium]
MSKIKNESFTFVSGLAPDDFIAKVIRESASLNKKLTTTENGFEVFVASAKTRGNFFYSATVTKNSLGGSVIFGELVKRKYKYKEKLPFKMIIFMPLMYLSLAPLFICSYVYAFFSFPFRVRKEKAVAEECLHRFMADRMHCEKI